MSLKEKSPVEKGITLFRATEAEIIPWAGITHIDPLKWINTMSKDNKAKK